MGDQTAPRDAQAELEPVVVQLFHGTVEFIPIKLLGAECEVHPEMMEGAAECPLRLQHGRKGEHEALPLGHRHAGESQERGRAGLQARARSTSHRGASFPQRYRVR